MLGVFLCLFSLLTFSSHAASVRFELVTAGVGEPGFVTNEITAGGFATIRLHSDFPQGHTFFTTDGSQPSAASTPYSPPQLLQFQTNTILRVAAYSSNFTENVRSQLTINILPAYRLEVTSLPPNIVLVDPAPSQQGLYLSNTVVRVLAPLREGFTFVRWEGDATGTVRQVQVVMNTNKAVHARYETRPNITYPTGGGTVEVSPEAAQLNEIVRLNAIPAPGHFFFRWGGSITGTTTPVDVFAGASISAFFAPLESNQVSFTVVHEGGGRLLKPSANVFNRGETVTVELDLKPTSQQSTTALRFHGWTGSHTGFENPLTLTLNESTLLRATISTSEVDTVRYSIQHFGSGSTAEQRLPAIADDGTVYFTSLGEQFGPDILSAYTSKLDLLWSTNTALFGSTIPSIGDSGNIYVGGANGDVRAVSPAGEILWGFQSGLPSEHIAAVAHPLAVSADETIYAAPVTSNVVFVVRNGQLVRSIPAPAPSVQPVPIIGPDGTLYLPTATGFSAQTPAGVEKWSAPYPRPSAIDAGRLYSLSGTNIVAFDFNGSNLWTTAVPLGATNVIISENSNLFTSTEAGVVALSTNGTILWTNSIQGDIVAKTDGGLIAYKTERPGGYTFSTIQNISPNGTNSWFEQWWHNTWFTYDACGMISPSGDIYQAVDSGNLDSSVLFHTDGDTGISNSSWPSVWGRRNTGRAIATAAPARLLVELQESGLLLRTTGLAESATLEASSDLQNWQIVQALDPDESLSLEVQERRFFRLRLE